MIDRYDAIMLHLLPKERKYIHYRSFKNFIVHLESIREDSEKLCASKLLTDYMNDIEHQQYEIDLADGKRFFLYYIRPIAAFYKGIGFVEILHLRYHLMLSIPFDIVVGLIFFKFPYPILSLLILIKVMIERMKHRDKSKYYCMFY